MNKKATSTFGLSGSMIALGIFVYIAFFTKLSIAKIFSNPVAIAIAVIVFVVISTSKQ